MVGYALDADSRSGGIARCHWPNCAGRGVTLETCLPGRSGNGIQTGLGGIPLCGKRIKPCLAADCSQRIGLRQAGGNIHLGGAIYLLQRLGIRL